MKIDDIPISFILCKGRSGSTLLQSVLNAHPHIIAPFESPFFIYLYHKYARKKNWTTAAREGFYEALLEEDQFREIWDINLNQLRERLLSAPRNTRFSHLIKLVYTQAKTSQKKAPIQLIVDKNPVHGLFIREIKSVFPKARFIHLIRDPRDNCLSHSKHFAITSITHAALSWTWRNRIIERHKQKHPEDFFTVFYEDFVEHPGVLIRKLTAFLSVDFNLAMLNEKNHALSTHHIEKERVRQFKDVHKKIGKPIDTRYIGRWKKELSPQQINKIEGICGDLMEQYHYKRISRSGQSPGFWEILKFKVWKISLKLYYRSPLSWRRHFKKLKNTFSTTPGK